MKKVSIIGVGKVGISLCAALLNSKFSVFISDKDKNLISKYKKKKFPLYEPGIKKIISQNFNRLTLCDDPKELIKKTDTTFIVVPTNSNNYGGFSNKYILQVFDSIKDIEDFPSKGSVLVKDITLNGFSDPKNFIEVNKFLNAS